MPEPTFEWVDIDLIYPNRYNPNVMDPAMYASAIESIHEFGFVDPVTVRVGLDVSRYELIDGEHRWKAAKDHGACSRAPKGGGWERHAGLRQLPITNLGDVSDEDAKQLTIVLNETRGSYDPKKMGALLIELVAVKPLAELVTVLPFTKDKIEELAELPKVDWGDVSSFKAKAGDQGERWVERVYRLPIEAAETLDKAIRQVKDAEGASDWQAIQHIAERYLET